MTDKHSRMREREVKDVLGAVADYSEKHGQERTARAMREAIRMIDFYSSSLGCLLIEQGGSGRFSLDAVKEYRDREELLCFERQAAEGEFQTIVLTDRQHKQERVE